MDGSRRWTSGWDKWMGLEGGPVGGTNGWV